MKDFLSCVVFVSVCSGAIPAAADKVGQQEFMFYCAGCHGADGKGGGPVAELLEIETPDLTTITQRAGGGEFPVNNTIMVIDGREVRAHGGDMPIWGDRFQLFATSQRGETADMVARGRILSLVYYLESIQQ